MCSGLLLEVFKLVQVLISLVGSSIEVDMKERLLKDDGRDISLRRSAEMEYSKKGILAQI